MAKDEKLGEAHVDITGKLTPLKRSMMQAKAIVRNGMAKLAQIVRRGAIVLGVAVGYNIWKMIRAASDAEEIQAKFGTVFKNLTQQANDWAKDYAKSVGRATQDVKKWMAGLQDLFVPLGMTRSAALKLDKELVKLAVDVASFNNQADEDVIRDFTSALVGNHETVRKYGIIISETSLKQAALNQGIRKSFKEITNLEKVQLRYALIMRGSTDAQGDAIRTSASFANQMKRLKASITDFHEIAGAQFLPKVTEIVVKLNEWLKVNGQIVAQKFGKHIQNISEHLGLLAKALTVTLGLLIAHQVAIAGAFGVKVIKGIFALLGSMKAVQIAYVGMFGAVRRLGTSTATALKVATAAAVGLKVALLAAGAAAIFGIGKVIRQTIEWGDVNETVSKTISRLSKIDLVKNQKEAARLKKELEKKGATPDVTDTNQPNLEQEKQDAIDAAIEKLEAQRDYYEKVGGYEKRLSRVRKELRKVEAADISEATGISEAEVLKRLKKASLKIDADMPDDIDTTVKASFIPLTEMWRTLSGGTRKINERILDINQKQLDETKRTREAIERGFETQKSGWIS